MAGGDRFDIDIEVGAGARLTVTTAAAEKIYRSLGPDTEIGVKLYGRSPAARWHGCRRKRFVFDQVRLRRSIDVDLARDANLLLAEAVVFGRSAMGETVRPGPFLRSLAACASTARSSSPRHCVSTAKSRSAWRSARVADGGVAIASVLKFPATTPSVAAVRAVRGRFRRRSRRIGLERARRWRGWSRRTVRRCAAISLPC